MLVLDNYSKAVVKKWGFNPNRIEMAKSFHWSKSYYYENLVWFYQNQGSYNIVVLQKLSLVSSNLQLLTKVSTVVLL
jgi:hypothetical protein